MVLVSISSFDHTGNTLRTRVLRAAVKVDMSATQHSCIHYARLKDLLTVEACELEGGVRLRGHEACTNNIRHVQDLKVERLFAMLNFYLIPDCNTRFRSRRL